MRKHTIKMLSQSILSVSFYLTLTRAINSMHSVNTQTPTIITKKSLENRTYMCSDDDLKSETSERLNENKTKAREGIQGKK